MPTEQIQETFAGMKQEEEQKKVEQLERVRKIQEKKKQVEELESTGQKEDVVEGEFDWTRKYAVMDKWEVRMIAFPVDGVTLVSVFFCRM